MIKLKRVSFKIAKAIKEAGYPQECGLWYNKNGIEFSYTEDYSECYARPTYIEVWLWLWREKEIYFYNITGGKILVIGNEFEFELKCSCDPEEVIITAIEYLVTNNLIK